MKNAPFDEYALDFLDEIDPQAKSIVRQTLAAVVDFPGQHPNGFSVAPVRGGGYEYFVAMGGGGAGPSPFRQNQIFPFDIVDSLLYHKLAVLYPKCP